MKKIYFCLFFLILFCFNLVWAQNFAGRKKQIIVEAPGKSLKVGEYLEYSVEFLGMPMGSVILKIEEITNFSGHQCYHFSGRLLTNKISAHFYNFEYEVNSYVDTTTFQPLFFQKKRRIKNKIDFVEVNFDWKEKKAISSYKWIDQDSANSALEFQTGQNKAASNTIADDTQDLLSSFYYFRLQDVKVAESLPVNIYYNQKNWPISITIEKPFLKEIRNQGTFSVFGASVNSAIVNFILGDKQFIVYFTTDHRRIPLEFDVGTNLGFIRCRLKKMS